MFGPPSCPSTLSIPASFANSGPASGRRIQQTGYVLMLRWIGMPSCSPVRSFATQFVSPNVCPASSRVAAFGGIESRKTRSQNSSPAAIISRRPRNGLFRTSVTLPYRFRHKPRLLLLARFRAIPDRSPSPALQSISDSCDTPERTEPASRLLSMLSVRIPPARHGGHRQILHAPPGYPRV